MTKKLNISLIFLLLLCIGSGVLFYSCEKDEDDTIVLDSWGPSPNIRGGDLKFIGKNLDKVTSVLFPDSIEGGIGVFEVSAFKTKTPGVLIVEIPQEADSGYISLRTPQGDLTTETLFAIIEPILIDTIYPLTVLPGDIITIEGMFLNLVHEIIFNKNIPVTEFESQSEGTIQVKVPENAQTGVITLTDGAEEPSVTESKVELQVVLPQITGITPVNIKAGSNLTITGTNLDLVQEILFSGGTAVTSFTSQSASQIVVIVPGNALDGVVVLKPASGVEVESSESIVLTIPAITQVSPNPAKNGSNITVQGTNLDIITSVVFGGNTEGTMLLGGTSTQITVTVPPEAIEDYITFNTGAEKSVVSPSVLNLVEPVYDTVGPLAVYTQQTITITGTNLDVISSIRFLDDIVTDDFTATETQIVLQVPSGAQSGKFTLVSTNGYTFDETDSLTITPSNAPEITSVPDSVSIGQIVNITGSNLDLNYEVIFPGGIKATTFGIKSDVLLQVYVPAGITLGYGRIKFVTDENEISFSPEIKFKE